MRGKIKILMGDHILYVSHTGYILVRRTKDYVELKLKKDNCTYFVNNMRKKDGINYCDYKYSEENVKYVDEGLYIVRTGDKDIIYNAKINELIGEFHDHIYPSMIMNNKRVFAIQDYIKNKEGKCVGLVSSYMSFDGNYLSKVYYDRTKTYYDPENKEFDYEQILFDIKKKARLVKVKTKA